MAKRLVLLFFCILFIGLTSSWNFPSTSTGTSSVTVSTTTITGNLTNFTDLWDTPDAYAGDGGDCVKVNAGETGLEFSVCGAVSEVDPKWTGNYSSVITEPLWSANYTNLNSTWSSVINTSYGLATEPLWSANYTNLNSTWSSIKNDSYYLNTNPLGFFNTSNTYNCSSGEVIQNITLNSSGAFGMCIAPTLSESDPKAYNGTLMYSSNYTDWNLTGLIKDWNITGYIINWTSYFINYNSTGLIQNWSLIITNSNEVDPKWTGNYSSVITEPLWSANYTTLNATWSSVVNTSYGLVTEPLWSANYTTLNSTWSSVINTSYGLATEPLWSANYTTLNSTWSSVVNTSYREFTNGTFTTNVNITTGNLSITNRIKLAIGDCSGLVAGEICRNATAIYIQG